ncbi:MAG TPA: CoA transferase [Ramlibacter sp.]|nr:CoA transferase [Ramlibacter sp.]
MTNPAQLPNPALHGIRVLDFSQMLAGPLAAMLLGDYGADVIKIEPPEGDALRRTGETQLGGETEYYLSANRNKRSLVVDLKSAAGLAIVRSLVLQADVLVENFRPGTADRLGIGYEAMRELNPRLVYCSLSGFGADSVHRDRAALDPVIQAMSGIMQLTGTPESGPLRTGFPVSDYVTPLLATSGILAALMARHTTGRGQRVDLTMLNATIFSMLPREGFYFATGKTPERNGNAHYQIAPYNTFQTADGRQVFLIGHNEKYWQALVQGLGEPGLAADARFATASLRNQHGVELYAQMGRIFATRGVADWTARLTEASALFSVVRTWDEVFQDPEVRRDMVREIPHPTAGQISVLANPVRLSESPVEIRRAPPLLGEHTQEVLREFGLEAS